MVHCVLTDILSSIVSELSQLIVQILDTAILSPFWRLIGTTYNVHHGLTGKRVVDFLFCVN